MKMVEGNQGRLTKSTWGLNMHVYTCTQSSPHTDAPTYILEHIHTLHIQYMRKRKEGKKKQLSTLDVEKEIARHRNETNRAHW